MNVGDRVTVQTGQYFVEGTILGIPAKRGTRLLYKVESAHLLTSPQWFDADSVHPANSQFFPTVPTGEIDT
jgi:hypothetical protein